MSNAALGAKATVQRSASVNHQGLVSDMERLRDEVAAAIERHLTRTAHRLIRHHVEGASLRFPALVIQFDSTSRLRTGVYVSVEIPQTVIRVHPHHPPAGQPAEVRP